VLFLDLVVVCMAIYLQRKRMTLWVSPRQYSTKVSEISFIWLYDIISFYSLFSIRKPAGKVLRLLTPVLN
jgi:hypothetical protein